MLAWLETTAYSDWVKASWGWALALTMHAFGNAIVVGLMFIIGLRLFGFFRSIPYPSLNRLSPIIWIGVGCQVYSGVTLWMSKPGRYLRDWVFDTKFSLVIIGVVLTILFQKTLSREAADWQANGTVSKQGMRLITAACVAWGFVIIMGRLTAYLGSLYNTN